MAVSVNPVDYKVRGSSPPADGDWKVLGWDAAGIVREVGSEVTQFKAGDEVYYAGSITRSGTNAQFHLVDARIVGKKPTLELTRFSGHLIVGFGGVHHGRQDGSLRAGV